MWPNLIRRPQNDRDEAEQAPLIDEDQMKELEESTLKVFKNLYWTRLIVMEDFLPEQQERYELGPDVAAVVDEMFRLDADAMPEWTPLFDP